MSSPRIMLSGGGTGGHIYPALAIAEIIKHEYPQAVFSFVGAQGGMEERIIPGQGYTLHTLPIRGLQRKITFRNLLRNVELPFRWWASVNRARKLIRQFMPDLVIGTGGYASLPLVSVAAQLGIPTALHEQNAYPGLSNRRLAGSVDLVMLGNPAAQLKSAHGSTVVTGNPVRSEFTSVTRHQARARLGISYGGLVVSVLGGSLGAYSINEALVQSLPALSGMVERLIWQCGRRYTDSYSEVASRYAWIDFRPFIDDMPAVMAASDLVVARAGALTLAELATVGCASVLVPSPHVAGNHQHKNAQAMHSAKAAVLVSDAQLGGTFLPSVKELLADEAARLELATNIRQFAFPHFRETIAQEINKLLARSGVAKD